MSRMPSSYLIRALIVRIIFVSYCFFSVWRVVVAYRDQRYWALLLLTFGLLTETFVTIRENAGQEWKWFSPAIFCFLLAGLPCVCLLELHLMEIRHKQVTQLIAHHVSSSYKETADELFGVYIPIYLDDFGWTLALEQSLLLILICCRGILPRGEITKEQLSQLLLVHMGMAADILELLAVFNEEQVFHAPVVVYPTLALWALSLMQYALVITSTKVRKRRSLQTSAVGDRADADSNRSFDSKTAEIFGILVSSFLQDLPFLTFRLMLLFGFNIISHMMIFFTCKNGLVVMLQIHRLIIVIRRKAENESP